MPDVSATTVPEKPKNPITWGPISAVIVTVVVYFLAQFLGSIAIILVGKGQGFNHAQLLAWVDQTGPQFFYTALVEGLTLGILWLFLKHRKASFKTLGLTKPQIKDLAYVGLGFVMYFPILIGVLGAAKLWFPQLNLEQQQQIGFHSAHGLALVVVFISLVVLPPISEEILTRGFLFLGLKTKLPVFWAAIVASSIFASAHLQAGSGAPLLWAAAIDTFVLSMVLVFLRQKTGRLWAGIGLHMLKNCIAFAALFIFMS